MSEKIVVHVRQDAERIACLAQSLQSAVGVGKRWPVSKTLRQEGGTLAGYGPAETLADTLCSSGQDFAIRLVWSLRRGAGIEQRPQHGRWVQTDPVRHRGLAKRLENAGLPVDEGPIAVKGNDVEQAHLRSSTGQQPGVPVVRAGASNVIYLELGDAFAVLYIQPGHRARHSSRPEFS